MLKLAHVSNNAPQAAWLRRPPCDLREFATEL